MCYLQGYDDSRGWITLITSLLPLLNVIIYACVCMCVHVMSSELPTTKGACRHFLMNS
jgi:hypothetical protein